MIDHTYAANNGRLTRSTYGNGFYTENIYDTLDRVTGIKYNGVEKYSWEYGNKGQVGLHKDLVNNQEFRYVYDSLGRVINVVGKPTASGFSRVEYANTYNAKNQLTKVIRKIASSTLQTQYGYTGSGQLLKETYNNGASLNYTYNAFGLVGAKKLTASSGATVLNHSLAYRPGQTENSITTQISAETLSGNGWSTNYGYTYDANHNITGITKNGASYASYGYDALNQLKTATVGSDTYAYSHDNGGNILSKTVNGVTTAYGYTDTGWKDLLTSYGGQSITYDTIGNPLSYRNGMTFTWLGRRLNTAAANGKTLSFAYNADGIRTQKTVNGAVTYYSLDGSKIIRQKTGSTTVFFEYDAAGNVATILHAGTTYYYIRNIFGDVIGLADANGNTVVSYTYDPWGKLLSISDSTSTGVGAVNPFRYRGYYYDTETGFYLTGTRYYDPEIGRFINADGQLNPQEGMTGYNLFQYCGNNPVNRIDPTGEAWWHWAIGAAVVAVAAVATVATCGGFAAAAGAVAAVGSGVAAATTASTIAAGAFIGSATVYGMAVVSAASTSSSVKEFNDKGNWGTVATTAFGGLTGGYDGYTMSKAQTPTSTPTNTSRGSTGRTEPANLREQLAMKQVRSNPSAGTQLTRITLNDPRWPSSEGWVKMQQIVPTSQGDINIHYVYNQTLKIFDDFKFKS